MVKAPASRTGTARKPAAARTAPARKAAAGGAKGAKGATQATVTLRHLAAHIAEVHELSKKHADELLGDVIDMMVKHLKKGDKVRIGGLGILQVRARPARMGRNPATGEAIRIKASKKVAFRAAKELKEAI